jgi:ATP-dependent Clp protease ATP-binding subunit ClpC
MFEHYTDGARRAGVKACIDAQIEGSSEVRTEHLLMGILGEDRAFVNQFVSNEISEESIRRQFVVNEQISRRIVGSELMASFSADSKRVLDFAAEEAALVGREEIGLEHLLLSILREKECIAAQVLLKNGADPALIRSKLRSEPYRPLSDEERKHRASDRLRKGLIDAKRE